MRYEENQHPRGRDGRWTRRGSSSLATGLAKPEPKVLISRLDTHGRDFPVSQVAIDYHMDSHGKHLGPADTVEVRCPAHGAHLPDTPALVTVRGGNVCRTPDQSHGRFEVRDGARLIARGTARTRVHAASGVDVYDQASADLDSGAASYLYGPDGDVRARAGSTVYAWAGSVRTDSGARV